MSPIRCYVLVLAVLTCTAAAIGGFRHFEIPGNPTWWAIPFVLVAYIVAEHLRVRFRRGDDADAWTLSESILAPLIFYFPTPAVVGIVALAHAALAVQRRYQPVKGAFNAAQWGLAAGVGSLALSLMAEEDGVTIATLGALVVAMAVVALINNIAFTLVMALSGHKSIAQVLKELSPIILPGWVGGWVVNLLMGLLFVMAAAGDPIAVVLFPVPLVVLFFAYRGYAAARADRQRLTGLRQAAQVLSEPLHPRHAIDDYLREVATCFESQAATLVLLTETGGYEIHALQPGPEGGVTERIEPSGSDSFESRLAAVPEPRRITAGEDDEMAQALAAAGWRDCICAPLVDEHRELGVLAVFDQSGLEGTATSDLAVLDALGRETAHTIARGRLFETVVEERRKFAQILGTTSDGIFTLAQDGSVLSWNAACEHITGLAEKDVLGRKDVLVRLEARTAAGSPVDFHGWSAGEALPREILLTHPNGSHRRLSVSSSPAVDFEDQAETLVVVARDITPADEYEELREQFSRLVEAQAAQRLVVDHLQKAVAPEPPGIDGADIAVAYVASDPTSPTGGDLFDWHRLPSGELHIAVVDVLGHGVTATKDALTVIHTLRFAAVEGTPLEDIVLRADNLLSAQESELVATVIVARYHPVTGLLKVVSGGHPPALVVSANGNVRQLAATGGAIGWPAVGSDNVVTTELGIHESMVLYTDGLIEARKDVLEGMDALMGHAAQVAHMEAAEFAEELVSRALAGADRRDDTLALVLRRTRVHAVPDRMRWKVDPEDDTAIRTARHGLRSWLGEHALHGGDPILVASELLANAVVVARDSVVLTAQMLDEQLVLEVSDDGNGNEHLGERGQQLPGYESENGRGLFLVRSLSEDVSVMSTTEGTVVRCMIAVRPAVTPVRPGS